MNTLTRHKVLEYRNYTTVWAEDVGHSSLFPVFPEPLQCPVKSLRDVTSGLALCCLAVEYVSLSKRFLPELVNFLAGTLHLAVRDKTSVGPWGISLCHRRRAPAGHAGERCVFCCRIFRRSTVQTVGEVQRPAGAVRGGVVSELEQEEAAAVGDPAP